MTKNKRLARKTAPLWEFRLYVADTSPRSVLAAGNLRRLCQHHLKTHYRITIVDIVKYPNQARVHNILATPTLVRVLRPRDTKVVGTLADTRKVLQALGVPLEDEPSFTQIGHA